LRLCHLEGHEPSADRYRSDAGRPDAAAVHKLKGRHSEPH
jgi:hypothetical protein